MVWKEYCAEYYLKELKERMNRWTGCHDITEILLKMASNIIPLLINQDELRVIYDWEKVCSCFWWAPAAIFACTLTLSHTSPGLYVSAV